MSLTVVSPSGDWTPYTSFVAGGGTVVTSMQTVNKSMKIDDYLVYHQGFKPTAADVGALDASRKVPLPNMVDSALSYDFHNFINGKPLANEIMMRAVVSRSIEFPANFAGSYAFCTTAATNAVLIEVLKNGVRIGTINFAAGSVSATFTATSVTVLSPADQLSLRNTRQDQDATWSDTTFIIKGTVSA